MNARSMLGVLLLAVAAPWSAAWTQVPGGLVQISAGSNAQVWGVSGNDDVWRLTSTGWTQVTGKLTNVAVAADGAVWGVDRSGAIYRRDGSSWTRIDGGLVQISVGSASNVWGVNASDQVWRFTGSTWQLMPGALTWVSAAYDGSVWGVSRSGQVSQWYNGAWKTVPGVALSTISAGSASNVWGVDATGQVWKWNRSNGSWTQMQGPLKQLAVGTDGSIWGVNAAGGIVTGSVTTWRPNGPPPALSANGLDRIPAGWVLRTNESLVSTNRAYQLLMQPDGNLCEYLSSPASGRMPGAIWCSSSKAAGGRFAATVTSNGNLCVTTGDQWGQGPNLWCTNKVTNAGATFARLDDDGNLYTRVGNLQQSTVLWSTGNVFTGVTIAPNGGQVVWPDGVTCPIFCTKILNVGGTFSVTAQRKGDSTFKAWTGACAGQMNPCPLTVGAGPQNVGITWQPLAPSANGHTVLMPNEVLRSGEYIVSPNNAAILLMQADGNLCTYRGSSASRYTGFALWCSNSNASGGRFAAILGSDGNLCVTTGDQSGQGPNLWCTNAVATQAPSGAFATITDSGVPITWQGTPQYPDQSLWSSAIVTSLPRAGRIMAHGPWRASVPTPAPFTTSTSNRSSSGRASRSRGSNSPHQRRSRGDSRTADFNGCRTRRSAWTCFRRKCLTTSPSCRAAPRRGRPDGATIQCAV